MCHIDLDVHSRTSALCTLDQQGRKVNLRTIKGHLRRIIEFLSGLPAPYAICREASNGYYGMWWHIRDTCAIVSPRRVLIHALLASVVGTISDRSRLFPPPFQTFLR